MKNHFRFVAQVVLVIAVFSSGARAQDEKAVTRMDYYEEAHQFLYFAVFEGLNRDGVTTAEVDQILLRSGGGYYDHFIYACPICLSAIHALETYRDRPPFYGLKAFDYKGKNRTFGEGLPKETKTGLVAKDAETRLNTINGLIRRWVKERFERSNLTDAQKKLINAQLAAGEKRGSEMMGVKDLAGAAYLEAGKDKGCAVCSGALLMGFGAKREAE